MSAPLITIEDAAGLLPIRAGNTQFDAKLTMLIASASAMIELALSRELDQKQRIEHFDTSNTCRAFYDFGVGENVSGVFLDPIPVRYVLKAFNIDMGQTFEVRYDITRSFVDDTTIVDPSHYVVDADKGILQIRYGMIEADQALQVTYTGGYAASVAGDLSATIPIEIKMACLAQVMHMFTKFTTDNIGKNTDTTDGKQGSVPYATKMGLVPEALTLLSRYKVSLVGRG